MRGAFAVRLTLLGRIFVVRQATKQGVAMSLIQCPECGREISDKASSCPNCGCPIKSTESSREVRIQIPNTQNISGGWVGLLSSKNAAVKAGDKVLWEGKHGQTAVFEIDEPTEISIDLGTWGKVVPSTIRPGAKYQLVQHFGFHAVATFNIAEVDVINSTDPSARGGYLGL